MLKYAVFGFFVSAMVVAAAAAVYEEDVIKTSQGDLKITFIGHASLMFTFAGKVIQNDPVGQMADYSQFPKADLILVAHEHSDHLDPATIASIRKPTAEVIVADKCAGKVPGAVVMKNGDIKTVQGVKVEAVPAYNIVNLRSPGNPYHPKGDGNGYVLTFGDKRIYIAGDTENIPEMTKLKDIDIAFLPMNLPYTMSPEMTAAAAKVIQPKILYPYHFGNTDTQKIIDLLKDQKGIEIRIRKLN